MQWRLRFPSYIMDSEAELKQLITARITQFQTRLAHGEGWVPTEETQEAAALPPDFLADYGMVQSSP
jgi:hypothetical protein